MGQVLLKFRIMPGSVDQDMDALQAGVASAMKGVDVKNMTVKPIAFGLKALEVIVVMKDAGGAEALESALNDVDGVQSVTVLDMDLL